MSSNSPMSFLANETEDRIDDIYDLCCEILPADLANLVETFGFRLCTG